VSADRALGAVWRELRRPRNLLRGTTPLIFAGPSLVLLAYVAAFVVTPGEDPGAEFHAAASQIIPVLLLVLAVEGQLFRWESSASIGADDLMDDPRFRAYASGEGPISEAVQALLDAGVDTVRNLANGLLRQITALLLLAGLLVGEIVSLGALLGEGPTSAKPVFAAIVGGFAGVAYVAITGPRFRPGGGE
jgi:hypothetical protein